MEKNVSKIDYNEAVLGSRRVRAAWQYYAVNDPEKTLEIEEKFKSHHAEMERIQLRSWELRDREKKISRRLYQKFCLLDLVCIMDAWLRHMVCDDRHGRTLPLRPIFRFVEIEYR